MVLRGPPYPNPTIVFFPETNINTIPLRNILDIISVISIKKGSWGFMYVCALYCVTLTSQRNSSKL